MTANVFEQIEQITRDERQQALGDYYEILADLDPQHPNAKDSEALAYLLTRLGKTRADAERDHGAVTDALRNVEWAATKDEAEARFQKLHAEYLAVCAERQQMHQTMSERVALANSEQDAAMESLTRATRARGELARLRDANPLLYAAIAPKPEKPTKSLKAK